MSDEDAKPESHPTPESHYGEALDPGEPVSALASLEYPPASPNFLGRIRGSLQRRTAASQIASFSWNVPFVVLMEFWLMLTQQFNPKGTRKDRRQ